MIGRVDNKWPLLRGISLGGEVRSTSGKSKVVSKCCLLVRLNNMEGCDPPTLYAQVSLTDNDRRVWSAFTNTEQRLVQKAEP